MWGILPFPKQSSSLRPISYLQSNPMGQFGALFEGPNPQELFSPAAVSCTSRSPVHPSISIFSVKNTPHRTFVELS